MFYVEKMKKHSKQKHSVFEKAKCTACEKQLKEKTLLKDKSSNVLQYSIE